MDAHTDAEAAARVAADVDAPLRAQVDSQTDAAPASCNAGAAARSRIETVPEPEFALPYRDQATACPARTGMGTETSRQ